MEIQNCSIFVTDKNETTFTKLKSERVYGVAILKFPNILWEIFDMFRLYSGNGLLSYCYFQQQYLFRVSLDIVAIKTAAGMVGSISQSGSGIPISWWMTARNFGIG